MQNDVNARINWFERHLNWTAAAMGVGSGALFTFLYWVILGFNLITPQDLLHLSFPVLLLFALFTFGWLLITSLGYSWLLYRKNRNPIFLIFCVPIVFALLTSLINKMFFFTIFKSSTLHVGASAPWYYPSDSNYIIFITEAIVTIFILSWVVFLLLKNHRAQDAVDGHQILQGRFFSFLFGSQKRITIATISVSGFSLAVFIVLFFYLRYGYITYKSPDVPGQDIHHFSFSYPAVYGEPVYNHVLVVNAVKDNKETFYQDFISISPIIDDYSHLSVTYTQLTSDHGITYESWRNGYLALFDNPLEYQQVVETEVMAGNIPAHQIAISVEDVYSKTDLNDIGNHISVFIEDGFSFWLIGYNIGYRFTPSTVPPPAFTHLLETFKIYDE